MKLLRLKEWRESRGLMQKEVAKEAGVSEYTVLRAEGGISIRPNTARKIAEALNVTVADLLEEPPVPLGQAPQTSPEQDEERRVTETSLGLWIEYIEVRADVWLRQATAEENHRLDTWQAALQWESDVSEEAADIFQAAEDAVQYLVKGEGAQGAIDLDELDSRRDPDYARSFTFLADDKGARALNRLEASYTQLWAARDAVARRVSGVLDRFAKQLKDTASIERARKKRDLENERIRKQMEERLKLRGA